jgi:hypothetical protein
MMMHLSLEKGEVEWCHPLKVFEIAQKNAFQDTD